MVEKKFNVGDDVVLKKTGMCYKIVAKGIDGQYFLKDIWAKKQSRFTAVKSGEIRERKSESTTN